MSFTLPHYMTSGSTFDLTDDLFLSFKVWHPEPDHTVPSVIFEALDRGWLRFDASKVRGRENERVIFSSQTVTVFFDRSAAVKAFSKSYCTICNGFSDPKLAALLNTDEMALIQKANDDADTYMQRLKDWYDGKWYTDTLTVSLVSKKGGIIDSKMVHEVPIYREGDNEIAQMIQESLSKPLVEIAKARS